MLSVTPPPVGRRLSRDATLLAHAALLAIEIGALFFFAEPWPVIHGFPIDDAWIHQVVARTFATTGTLGYAPGQFGGGATSYLWAALLSTNYRWVHADPVVFTLALNVALYLGSGAVLLSILLRDGLRERRTDSAWFEAVEAVLVVGLASIGGNYLWFTFSGMEATLVIFLSLAAIACVSRRPSAGGSILAVGGAAAVAGLALARPETMALGPVLAWVSHRSGHRRRDTALLLGCWAAAVALYFGANLAATGSALPATLGGRKWIWIGDADGGRALLLWDFACTWLARLRNYTLGTSSDVAFWISLGLAILALTRLARARRRWALLGLPLIVAWAALHFATYTVLLPAPGHGGRYQPLLPPLYLLLVGLGSVALIEEIVGWGERRFGRSAGWVGRCAEMASLIPWFALVLVGVRDWSHDHARAVVHIRTTELGLGPLVDALPPQATVASFDIGGIGFSSHRPILDIGGLSDPSTAALLKSGTIWTYLRDRRVSYVVLPEEYESSSPGSLNFGYRLHLLDNPALDLRLMRALETPPWVWMPAIHATAGSAPRQALYQVRFTGKPGRHAADATPLDIEDGGKVLSRRWRAVVAHGLRALAAAGVRARLSLDTVRSDDGALTPDDAWWIQIGPWGVHADPPRTAEAALQVKVTALMLDRLRPYIDADDMPGAALLSMHVLVDAVRRWVDPEVLAMLPPVNPPGAVTDSDQVLDALPLGIGCVSGVLLVAFGLSSLRRREGARMPRVVAGVPIAGPETVGADAI
jgi:hypothetical protein